MLLCFDTVLWSIIGDAGLFVSSVVPSAQVPLSFHILTGNMGSRPTTTSVCRILLGLAVLWGLIGLPALGSCADDGDFARTTLRGLQGVSVLIEDLTPENERAGLTTQQLQIDVEGQLQHAGIPVLTKDQAFHVQGAPFLYVYVHLLPHPIGLTAYSSLLEVNQRASLDLNGSSASVSTWSVQRLGTVGSRHLAAVRNDVRGQVDHFINVYRSVNSPPADRAMPPSTSLRRAPIR